MSNRKVFFYGMCVYSFLYHYYSIIVIIKLFVGKSELLLFGWSYGII